MRAKAIATTLGGLRVGGGCMARCPEHDDKTPSLSIRQGRDGKVLVRCHAGCEQAAVIAALRSRGLWDTAPADISAKNAGHGQTSQTSANTDERKRTAFALKLWCASGVSTETPVEVYLRSRGIWLAPPARLKFHPRLNHCSGTHWPAMIALVTRGKDDRPIGIHRTYLLPGGLSKAPVKPNKMMLAPCRGGTVRLGPLSAPLLIGEGIETCLSAMQATGYSAWAALSTSGLRTLELPSDVRDVIVLADGDGPGEDAAVEAAARWNLDGRRVRIARAPGGADFNDILVSPVCDEVAL